ncbi:type II toxin-antitoxin system ParD family antitoxin [Sphingomonas sp. Leaf242]|uniref:type II toxin-antitoxin system ParD family antitoxin n=1 Tax=Sphingomonas sp. Leaf242 TaxID=1736304 RepID=UPI0009E7063E
MASTLTRNVTLTIELEAYIKAQVPSGRFSSSSEIVRSALRPMIERDETRTMGLSHAR